MFNLWYGSFGAELVSVMVREREDGCHLAGGDSFHGIHALFRVPKNSGTRERGEYGCFMPLNLEFMLP